MSFGSYCNEAKRMKLDFNEETEEEPSIFFVNSNLNDLLNSPSDTCENISTISAFDHDSLSILSGSLYESGSDVLSTDTGTKGILKTSDYNDRHLKRPNKMIKFHEIEIFYFNRQQSFCSVPSVGGSALGMDMDHFSSEKLTFDTYFNRSRKKINSYSNEKIKKYSKEDYSTLQPIVAKYRRILLKNSDADQLQCVVSENISLLRRIKDSVGISRVETVDKETCDLIRSSRERCGCQCVAGQCLPETCSCAQSGIQCQVDRGNFPCCCGLNPCMNPFGRVEFNPIRVRTHFIHTMMRLQMQNQYQTDEPNRSPSLIKSKYNEDGEGERTDFDIVKSIKDFDISLCNSTDQGSCRDCQNDKYLQVLMTEWTHQLRKLHSSKHYSSHTSSHYNAYNNHSGSFASSTYSDKNTAISPVSPYSHHHLAHNVPILNHQVHYRDINSELQYSQNTMLYPNDCAEKIFDTNVVHLTGTRCFSKPPNDKKENTLCSFANIFNGSERINDHITDLVYSNTSTEKTPIYHHCDKEKCPSYLCKYNANFSTFHCDIKDSEDPNPEYITTVPYVPNKSDSSIIPTNHFLESPTVPDDFSHKNKIAQASNGQLYTVLQPVSESRIVASFYENSQATDSCTICRSKSIENRQLTNHLCISDFSMDVDDHRVVSTESVERSEVCA